MEYVLHFASAAAFYIFTFSMFETLYPRRISKSWQVLCIITIITVGMATVGLIQEPVLNFSYSVISMLLLNKILYNPKGKTFIVYDILLVVIMSAIEMVSVSLLAYTVNIELQEVLESNGYTSAAMAMNWLLLFFAFRIFIFVIARNKINSIKTQEFIFFLILIFGEIFFLRFINDVLVLSKSKYEVTIILILFLVLDLHLTYLIYKMSEAYELEKKYELLNQQSQLQLSAYKDLNGKYDVSRKIIHDVRKHVSALEGLINNNNAEAAEKYKGMLNKELNRLIPQFESDNPIFSVIINDKLTLAEGMNIDFKVNVEYSDFTMSDLDVTAIFANLLDNAFEACAELPENKRYVQLSVARHNYFLIIYLENTYKEVQLDERKKLRSTKSNHQGIGLSNVKSAVEKYGGSFGVKTEEDLFKAEILISLPDNAE